VAQNLAGITFDVQTRLDGRWTTANLHESRSDALTQAEALVAKGKVEAVRVIAESERKGAETIFEHDLGEVDDKPVQIVPIDDAPPCDDVAAVYGFESRRSVGRLMRRYLDREGISALELLFDATRLTILERGEKLLPSAVQRVAAIQAKAAGVKPAERADALYAFIAQAKEHARDTEDADAVAETIMTDGLDAGVKAAEAKSGAGNGAADILIAFALARIAGRQGDWAAKLGTLAGLIDNAESDAARNVLDAACAEMLDGSEALGDLMGGAGDLASATRTLIRLGRGRAGDSRGASAHMLAVNNLIAAGGMRRCRAVLADRVAGNLSGTRALTRDKTDADALSLLVRESIEQAGLFGGPPVAAAFVRRARLALSGGGEDLEYFAALERVLGLMPHVLVRLGFLLDVAAAVAAAGEDHVMTPVGEAFERIIQQIEHTAAVFPQGTPQKVRRAVADGLTERAAHPEVPNAWRPRIESALRAVAKATAAAETAPPIDPKHVRTIAMSLETVTKPAGDLLFNEGDPADTAFLIRSGRVDIIRKSGDEEHVIGRMGRGEIIGELALIDGLPRSATARVGKDCELVVITRDDLAARLNKVGEQDMVVRRLIDVLVSRVRGHGGGGY
jgi:hypothetical protein